MQGPSLRVVQEHFDFLDRPANGQHRTTFYSTLARLLFMDDSPQRFRSFVAPLQQVGGSSEGRYCLCASSDHPAKKAGACCWVHDEMLPV